MRQIFFNFLLFICIFPSIYAQQDVQQYIDTPTIYIGDQINIVLESKEDISGVPLTALDTLTWLNVIDHGKWEKNQNGIFQKKILFTVFDSGFYIIPNIFSSPYYKFNLNKLSVDHVPNTRNELMPIKDIIETKQASKILYYAILGFIFIGLMAGLLWFFFYGDRGKSPKIYVQAPLKPAEIALSSLSKISEQKYWQKNQVAEYYSEINETIRHFLSAGLKIPALENTSREILTQIDDKKLSLSLKDELSASFRIADYAKFATKFPDISEHDGWLNFARNFVEKNSDLSDQILDQHQVRWSNLLSPKLASQFAYQEEIVPDLLQHSFNTQYQNLILLKNGFTEVKFSLPEKWIEIHKSHQGKLLRYQNFILEQSQSKWIRILLLILILPFVAIALPILLFIGYINKESVFDRGIFFMSKENKLIVHRDKL